MVLPRLASDARQQRICGSLLGSAWSKGAPIVICTMRSCAACFAAAPAAHWRCIFLCQYSLLALHSLVSRGHLGPGCVLALSQASLRGCAVDVLRGFVRRACDQLGYGMIRNAQSQDTNLMPCGEMRVCI